jgi:UDPglucose 6-dehydrogenase
MKVAMIGTGYVGLVSGTCFAEMGHDVCCIDISKEKIELLKKGQIPIYEPGLMDLVERNTKKGRLTFSTEYEAVPLSQFVFLAVGTPSSDDGKADLGYLMQAAVQVAKKISDDTIIVIKSTVPVGTCESIRKLISENTKKRFHMVNNPEFLKEGSAVEDFMKPDRVVIGYKEEEAAKAMEELYAPLMLQGNPIFKMSNVSAEMTKYAANCFLAIKISFINEIAKLCDLTGADIEEVRKGITSDVRIGKHFLYPGPGYGGSCFPKDVKALMHTAKENDFDLKLVRAADDVNNIQKLYLVEKAKKYFKQNLKGKTIAVWGVAFKPNTDDIREAPAISICEELLKEGAKVQFYDPVANQNFETYMKSNLKDSSGLKRFEDQDQALQGADALMLLTEWREFRAPDFIKVKEMMKAPVIFDGRNLYNTTQLQKLGFTYFAIGKHIPA